MNRCKYCMKASVFLSVLVGLIVVLSYSLDWGRIYSDRLVAQMNSAFGNGATVHIAGGIEGSFIFPKFRVKDLYVEYDDGSPSAPSNSEIFIKSMEIKTSVFSMLVFSPSVSSVVISGMELPYSVLIHNLASSEAGFDLIIKDSKVKIGARDRVIAIQDIKITQSAKKKLITGLFKIASNDYDASATINFTGKSNYTADIKINSPSASLAFSGKGINGVFDGEVSIQGKDLSLFVHDITLTEKVGFFSSISSHEDFFMSASLKFGDDAFTLDNLVLSASSLNATGALKYKSNAVLDLNIAISKLDVDNLINSNGEQVKNQGIILDYIDVKIPKGLLANISINTESIKFRNKISKDLNIEIKLAQGEGVLQKMMVTLPGNNNHINISGRISSNNIHSRLIGHITGIGEDFDTLAEWILMTNIPKEKRKDNNKVRLDADLYIAPRIFDLSAINLIMDDGNVKGEIRIKSNLTRSVIGDFEIYRVNLDRLDIKFLQNSKSLFSNDWLRGVQYNAQINTLLRSVVWVNQNIDSLSFIVNSGKGSFTINKMKLLSADGNSLSGNFSVLLQAQDIRPHIALNIEGEQYDAGLIKLPLFLQKVTSGDQISKIMWTTDKLSFWGLEQVDGALNAKIAKIKTTDGFISDFVFSADLKEGLLTVKKFSVSTDTGFFISSANIGMGDSPSLSAVFSSANVNVLSLLSILGITNLEGNVSISGTLRTQGANMMEWISKLVGKIDFAARGLNVKGIDINSFIEDLFTTKSKSDIVNLTQISLYVGDTIFHKVDGSGHINNGVLSSTLNLEIDNAVGSAASNFSLLQFINLSLIRFFFIPPNSSNAVFMDMGIQGLAWQPKITFNVDDLYNIVHGKTANN